jgi:type I restriction enzyme S subunit
VQSEIVRILDNFTELTAELTAELRARKKQYSYYRDKLLSFEDGEVEFKSLGEVAQYSKARISSDLLNNTNYVGVDNLLQNRAGKIESNYVPTEGNSTKFVNNDILIGNIRPYLKKIWFADCEGGTNGDVLVIHLSDKTINPRFLFQVLSDDRFFDFNMQYAKGAKMPRGNKEMILKFQIPIPPLAEQERIVSILDKFDTLTNSISEGLPKEIALRQKQYEYYRDLLLTFPKQDVEA